MSINVHTFESTHEAYDASQIGEWIRDDNGHLSQIKDGDVLVVPSEGIIGVLIEAWPTAVVWPDEDCGSFHRMSFDWVETAGRVPSTGKDYSPSFMKCLEVAHADADITGNEHWADA